MSISAKDLLDAIDRVLPTPFKYGVFLLLLAAATKGSIRWGLISKDAVFGQVGDIAGIVLAIGAALIALALLLSVVSMVARAGRAVCKLFASRAETKRLFENMSFLPPESRALLLVALRSPSGRFPSPGESQILRMLYDFKLVESDRPSLTFHPYAHGKILRVVKPVYSKRDELIDLFVRQLSDHTGLDFNDNTVAFQYVERSLRRL